MKYFFSIWLFVCSLSVSLWAQETPPAQDSLPADTLTLPSELDEAVEFDNLPVDESSIFNLIFTRGFMMTGTLAAENQADSVPLNGGSSGSFQLHAGIKIPIYRNRVGLRLSPGISWTNIVYNQLEGKTFPTLVADSLPTFSLEKHGQTHVSLPLGVYVNITTDEDGDPVWFLEAGGYLRYMMAASYKVKYEENGLQIKEKARGLHTLSDPEFNRLSYGLYARLGYKWFSAYANMRLTEVFDEFTNDAFNPRQNGTFKNPIIPPIEVGFSIFIF
ncbi:MAG: outer membrane beta-barrel protein [Bacteroidota bacterium]